ncbi:hypothetical protein HMPREF9120_01028 [Neisseria sp. oral taxon 020 str. F0370]|uniref:HvfC family RiPP maturation protein n=1 Tax=unclassified Neisseria TaxID=2623750 RepID=UPI0002A3E58B|nr:MULTISPECIES: putative DNA-binding domain-containing protein [unclassified Neisseria]ASP17927.1 DUF2063 domain-containing protein [Neisseria sp. KEM232]EKY07342.1 hypothetical protein HMPREF9120_01028 [Neisseria sp. oral taxon 020 str. F0370]
MNTKPHERPSENPAAAFQAAFADHARDAALPPPAGIAPERLAVYRRLLLNNLRGFLELCFSGSSALIAPEMWQRLQERFLIEARPQSPFFNDIPKQFLDYLAAKPAEERPSENILHMMAFETDLLHAETAEQKEPLSAWDADTVLQWAAGARLKDYPCDFVSSELETIDEDTPAAVLTWRDPSGTVYYRALDGADRFLLAHFQEAQSDTVSSLAAKLAAFSDGLDSATLNGLIAEWVEAGVLLPVSEPPL